MSLTPTWENPELPWIELSVKLYPETTRRGQDFLASGTREKAYERQQSSLILLSLYQVMLLLPSRFGRVRLCAIP